MKLKVVRKWFTDKSTIGELFIDNVFECYTLEDVTRPKGVKIDGKTAIPIGDYKIVVDFSNRFQKLMPHVLNVPGFEGIRIHAGNTDKDTEGCLLLGQSKGSDFIGSSKLALASFLSKLENGLKSGEVRIEYKEER
jgi:hypothetical protein